jgi:hypothetical protein
MDEQEVKRLQRKKDKPLSVLDRLVLGTLADDLPLGSTEDPVAMTAPALWEWLTRTTAGKDHVMPAAVVSIALVSGGVQVTVNHRGLNQSFSVTCQYLSDWVTTAEAYLTGPTPSFKAYGRGQPKVKKRRTIA